MSIFIALNYHYNNSVNSVMSYNVSADGPDDDNSLLMTKEDWIVHIMWEQPSQCDSLVPQ